MSGFPFYNLRVALLGFVLVPALIIMAVSGTWALNTLEKQVEERMQEDIELIARAIRLSLSYALEQGQFTNIERALTSAFRFDRVYGVYVYDENGQQISGSGSPEAQVKSDHAARLASEGNRRGEYSHAGEEPIFSYFVPLTDRGGRINGLLQITRRGSDFSDYIALVRNNFLFVFISMSIILMVIVLVGHYGAIGRFLRQIEHDIVQIGSGETDYRIAVRGPSEIRVLANGINDMLERIARSRRELEKQQSRATALQQRLHFTEKLAAIGQLASGVAHELGTPLSTVDGKAQQLLRRTDMSRPVRQSVEQIRTESSRMEEIIRQLLDFGRRNPLKREYLGCLALIRSALSQLSAEIESRKINVLIDDDSEDFRIAVDRVRMEQAVLNLLKNAIHACRTCIKASCRVNSDGAVISIEDDGNGISEVHRDCLFDPFFTTKPVGQGTGLGLSVTHTAVKDHGGEIIIERSTTLGGACFSIYLDQDCIVYD